MFLLALLGLAYLPGLGLSHLRHEEPRRAIIARDMIEGSSLLVPRYEGEVYTAKPPLFNWLIAACGLARGGVDEVAARLPSVLCLAALVLLMVGTTERLLLLHGRAFLGLGLLLSPEIVAKTALAEIELAFALVVTASLWVWFLAYERGGRGLRLWCAPGLLAGMAFLTKREPGLVFFYLPIAVFLLRRGRWRDVDLRGVAVGLALPVAVALSWLAVMAREVGTDALWESLLGEVIRRGSPSSFVQLSGHVLVYPLAVWMALMPFSIFLLPVFSRGARNALARHYGGAFEFALVSVLVSFPVYWLRGDAAVRYFIPMFPFLLLIAAMVFERYCEGTAELSPGFTRAMGIVAGALPAMVLIASVLLALSSSVVLWPQAIKPVLPWTSILPLAAALAFTGFKVRAAVSAGDRRGLLWGMAALLIAVRLISVSVALPLNVARLSRRENPPALLSRLRELLPEGQERLLVLGHLHSALWFYAPPGLLEAVEGVGRDIDLDAIYVFDERATGGLPPTILPHWQELGRFPYKSSAIVVGRLLTRSSQDQL